MNERKSTNGTAGARRLLASAMLVVLAALTTNLVVGTVAAEPPTQQDYFGVVVSVSAELLVISADGTIVDIPVASSTKVRLPRKRDAQITDLAEGDRIAVTLEEEDGVLTADTIFLIPGKTETRHVPGEVTSFATSTITIQPVAEGADPITFNVSTTTTIRLHKDVTGIDVGSFVIVVAGRDSLTGELLPDALEIHVVPKRSPRPDATGVGEPTADPTNRVEIEGILEGISTTTNLWIIDGTEVEIDASTKIDDGVVVGDLVEVDGVLREDGTILALEIETRDDSRQVAAVTRIVGIFEGLDSEGNWIISGTIVTVGPDADTDGLPSVGQRVKVKALVQPDGSLLAREVENIHGSHGGEDESSQVKIEGIFQEIDPDGNWIVNGTKVSIGPDTRLKGTPAVGQLVEVKGRLQEDGSILATRIEGEGKDISKHKSRVELEGVIQEVLADGTLVIDGIEVHISALTELEGDPVAGDYVEVEAFLAEDGTLIAREVESKGSLEADEVPDLSEVKIKGTIDQINDDGTFVVNGITVATTTITEIRGDLAVGGSVKIEGVLQADGTLLASEIKGEGRRATSSGSEVKLKGLVEVVNRDANGKVVSIVVDGFTVAVEALTRIKGTLEVGSSVEVKGIFSDGVFLAGKIEADEEGEAGQEGEGEDGDGDEGDQEASTLKIEGRIESIATTTEGIVGIRVNGVDVAIASTTDLKTDLQVGDSVEVRAVLREGAVVATKVEAEEAEQARPERSAFKLVGVVESVVRDDAGNIVGVVVQGRSIEVQPLTRVKGLVEPGLRVKVRGVVIGDTLVARKIEGDDEGQEGERGESGQEGRDELEFRGVVASITAGATSTTLVLEDGSGFLLLEGTKITGELVVGAQVRVEAEFTEGLNVATNVKVEGPRGRGRGENGDDEEDARNGELGATGEEHGDEVEFSGIVVSVTADATSTTVVLEDGTRFLVQESTEVRGEIIVGASVTVKAVESGGVSVATKIRVGGPRDSRGGENGDDDENGRDPEAGAQGEARADGSGGGGTNGDREEDGRDPERGAQGQENPVELEFSGIVASITSGATSTTVVLEDGTSFVVHERTEVRGEIIVGASVTVKAVESDGVSVATNVRVEGSRDGGGGENGDRE